jgi:mitochondrial fission protein ELM1
MGLPPAVKRIRVRRPWRWLPPGLVPYALDIFDPAADALAPPWPDVLITCGRQAVAASLAVRRASQRRTFTVHIQNPTVSLANFDVVVAPRHDRLSGANLIETLGGLSPMTQARLDAAAARFAPDVADLPRPLVAVLVGGHNKVYRLTEDIARRLGRQLAEMSAREGAALLVTPSRRTPPGITAVLRDTLSGAPAVVWNGTGENPYFAYLSLADAIVVTGDSVNMVSEAATTGKPVFVVDLAGGSAKFSRFHETMRAAGVTRPFEGRLERWTYAPLRDTARTAAEIRRRFEAHRGGGVAKPAACTAARVDLWPPGR